MLSHTVPIEALKMLHYLIPYSTKILLYLAWGFKDPAVKFALLSTEFHSFSVPGT